MKYLVYIAAICLLVGCKLNYSFTGADIPAEAKTISVKLFPNYASQASPTLSQSFTEALRDVFLAQTNLDLIRDNGDLHYEGSITGYVIQPVAVQSNETAASNRLTISVQVKYVNSLDETKNFETTFSRFADYGAEENFSSIEEELIKEINDQLTQDIFNKSLSNW